MRHLFDTEGPVLRALSELLTLIKLNLLTLVFCIPVITAGAALTAMHYCIMKMMDGEDARVVSMYVAQFKGNFKSVTPAWLIFGGMAAFLYLDTRVFPAQGEGQLTPLLILVYFLAIILFALYQWLFPLAARFENGTAAKFKNALQMTVGALPRTAAMMFFSAVVPFILTQDYRFLPLAFILGLSLPGYLCALFYYPVIKRQIRKITGEEEDEGKEDAPGKSQGEKRWQQ